MRIERLEGARLAELKSKVSGDVLVPDEPAYERQRKIFNGMIDRRPAAIVRCADTEDVAATVAFARRTGIDISVRGGGHGVSGAAVDDGVLTIDLSAMRGVTVDAEKRIARVKGGATWGDLDAATQAHGLAVTGGRVATTGVAGLTLGSGSGWLERTIGFTCDHFLSAEIVLADGSTQRVSDVRDPELMWGLRGGGGNFGVVTEFVFRLSPIGPGIFGGSIVYDVEDAPQVLRGFRDFMATAPDEVGCAFGFVTNSDSPSEPDAIRGKQVASIVAVYFGSAQTGERTLAPLRKLGTPVSDSLRDMTYIELQTMNEGGNVWGRNNYFKADFLSALSDAAIDAIVGQARKVSSPYTALLLQPLGGALSRVPAEATPLGRRDAAYAYHCLTCWEGDDHQRHIDWTRNLSETMKPFATSGVYLTYFGDEGEQRVKEAYGVEKYARLVAIKTRVDPTNLFCRNQNIRPSAQATRIAAA